MRWAFIKILNIELDSSYIKIIGLKKSLDKIYIDSDIEISYELDKENICDCSNKLSQQIRYELGKLKFTYKNIIFNTQDENLIIRNINLPNIKSKTDIRSMIIYEINQYIPVNLDDYKLKYKIISSNNDELNVQVILFPNYLINLCNEIASKLGMKSKSININFDILQKLIKLKKINLICKNSVIIENRKNEIIVNKIEGISILESYILKKSYNIENQIYDLTKEYNEIYYYGDENFIEVEKFNLDIKYIDLNNKLKLIKSRTVLLESRSKYINCIGVML